MNKGIPVVAIMVLAMLIITLPLTIIMSSYFKIGVIQKASGDGLPNGVCSVVPSDYSKVFSEAGAQFGVQPAFIAAIFAAENGVRDPYTSSSWPSVTKKDWSTSGPGAQGPFQFMPPTWQQYGNGGNVQDINDAAPAAAHYLSAIGAGGNTTDTTNLMNAASRYNSGRAWEKGQNIKETNDYVLKYVMPAFKSFYCASASSGSALTSSSVGANGVPYFSQYDPRWAKHAYGTTGKTVASSGCCPTSAAMVLKFYGKSVDPIITADFGTSHGAYIPNVGSDQNVLFSGLARNYGLQEKSVSWETTLTDLQNKKPIIVAGTGSAPFTSAGHCVVLTNYNPSTNMVSVNDPNASLSNSSRGIAEYPLAQVKGQSHGQWYIGL